MNLDKIEELYKEVDENFDWKRVRKVMKFLDWWWTPTGKVPSKKQLKEEVYKLSVEAFTKCKNNNKSKWTIATGGFYVTYCDDSKNLDVSFVLEGWDTVH